MTVIAVDLPTNHLNVNEIEDQPLPNSLELGKGKEGESNDIPIILYIIRLGGWLESEKLPLNLVKKLNCHSIYTIYDLVRYRENQLSRLEGITLSDLAKITSCLKRINLHLDTDVVWVEEYKDYYINKKQRT